MKALVPLHSYCNVTCAHFSSLWKCELLSRRNGVLFIAKSSKGGQKLRNIKQRLWVSSVNDLSPPWKALIGGSYSHCWLLPSLCLRESSDHESLSTNVCKMGQSPS